MAAKVLRMNLKTARHIVRIYEATGRVDALPRGGRKIGSCKFDEEMRQALIAFVDANPLATLKALRTKLSAQLPNKPPVTIKTLARALEGALYTFKIATKNTDIRLSANSQGVIEKRREYALLMTELQQDTVVVYIDETGYNLWTRRSQGWSRRGQPVRRRCPTQRGPNLSICLAVSSALGLVKSEFFRGGQTKERFQHFVNDLVEQVVPQIGNARVVIVCDGPTFHRGVAVPEQHRHQFELHLLPAYSPFLNPCEMAHSAVKASIKL